LERVLDAADEQMLLLETTRGCVFNCKFCYYPKSYDAQYFLSREAVLASLAHARNRKVREVFLLDPTLNQREDFAGFIRTLAEGNPGRSFRYFGELRAEGITPEIARLLAEAGFEEVEVGLQSIEPEAMGLMDRKNNLKAFERGTKAMLDAGIKVTVDLIVGLPGDTASSIRRGLSYLVEGGLYSRVQVFNLAILPGTAFRHESADLGLIYQPRPPYYVLRTPTLDRSEMYGLMQEAEELLGVEFDSPPQPVLDFNSDGDAGLGCLDLDSGKGSLPDAAERHQVFTLQLRSEEFCRHKDEAVTAIREVLDANPFTTLQLVLEPKGSRPIAVSLLRELYSVCLERPTYLDKFYAVQPGRPNGAKRLVLALPFSARQDLHPDWLMGVGEFASIAWLGAPAGDLSEIDLEAHEYVITDGPVAETINL
jgi:hypothetical protein